MACQKCKQKTCCCKGKKAITRKGITGPTGPRGKTGPAGATGPSGNFDQVVGQSAFWGGITGAVGTTAVGTTFNNLASNFFIVAPKFFSLSIGLGVTAGAQHTVIAYFKKNGVQVGPTYEKTMFAKDHLYFQTELIQFSSSDTLDLYMESTALDCEVTPGHLINYRIV